jgi:hypothetical protein
MKRNRTIRSKGNRVEFTMVLLHELNWDGTQDVFAQYGLFGVLGMTSDRSVCPCRCLQGGEG